MKNFILQIEFNDDSWADVYDDSGKVLINNCWFDKPGKGEQFRLKCEGKTLEEVRSYAKERQKDRDVIGLMLHDNDYSK